MTEIVGPAEVESAHSEAPRLWARRLDRTPRPVSPLPPVAIASPPQPPRSDPPSEPGAMAAPSPPPLSLDRATATGRLALPLRPEEALVSTVETSSLLTEPVPSGPVVPPGPLVPPGPVVRSGPGVGGEWRRWRAQLSAWLATTAPGVALALIGAAAAAAIHQMVGGLSVMVLAVVIGIVVGNLDVASEAAAPGLKLAAKKLLRVGVVLLGLRLSVGQLFELGPGALLLVVGTVVVTFFGIRWLGPKLGLSDDLSLLVATGYSICGASAIAAVEGSTDADEEEVAAAIGLVTLAGSLAIFVIPTAARLIGLDEQAGGAWVGASIHDVAQVVAAGSAVGTAALSTAVLVKLTRVVLLAPIVAGLNARRPHSSGPAGSRPPLVPLFVAGFLAMVVVRSTGLVPTGVVSAVRSVESMVFAVALVGLGANVKLRRLRALGPAPLVLGGLAWLLIAVTSLVGVLLVY